MKSGAAIIRDYNLAVTSLVVRNRAAVALLKAAICRWADREDDGSRPRPSDAHRRSDRPDNFGCGSKGSTADAGAAIHSGRDAVIRSRNTSC